jgi:sec-independent protein translocase protein TatB
MNFIGIGPQELIVILVIALVFVGPQRLPRLAADLARMIREIRQYTGGIAAEFNEAIKDFEKDTEPERAQWKEIGQGLGDAAKTADEVAASVASDAAGTQPPASTNGSAAPTPNGATPEPAATPRERA